MATDKRISAMTELTETPAYNDELVLRDDSTDITKRISVRNLLNVRDVDSQTNLATAVAAWNTDGSDVTLLVKSDQNISVSLTVNSNISLIVLKEATITVAGGQTLTSNGSMRLDGMVDGTGAFTPNGSFEADLSQHFGSSITVSFGAGAVVEVYPEWWGENTTPGTTDMTAEIQAAIDSFSSGGDVIFPGTTYLYTGLNFKTKTYLKGSGAHRTQLNYSGATGDAVTLPATANRCGILDLKLYSVDGSTGWGIVDTATGATREFVIDRYEIEGFLGGIKFVTAVNSRIGQGRIIGQGIAVANGFGIDLLTGCTTTKIEQSYISACEIGIRTHSNTSEINSPVIETCGTGIKVEHYTTIINPYFGECTKTIETNGSGFFLSHPTIYESAVLVADIHSTFTFDASGKNFFGYWGPRRTAIRAYRNTEQVIGTGAATKVEFADETFDRNGEYANYKFTATKQRGWYRITSTIYWKTALVGQIHIYKNGASIAKIDHPSGHSFNISDLVKLDRDDYIEIYVYQSDGVDRSIDNGSDLSFFTVDECS